MFEHKKTVEIEVPAHMIDKDGNLRLEFYDRLFGMLGKDYDGTVINSINLVGEPQELDKPTDNV